MNLCVECGSETDTILCARCKGTVCMTCYTQHSLGDGCDSIVNHMVKRATDKHREELKRDMEVSKGIKDVTGILWKYIEPYKKVLGKDFTVDINNCIVCNKKVSDIMGPNYTCRDCFVKKCDE